MPSDPLVLVVAAGIGLWADTGDSSEDLARSGPADQAVTAPLTEGTAPRMGGMAELYRERAAAAGAGALAGGVLPKVGEPPFTVFLVESEEAAGRLAQELEMIMPAGGALPRTLSREYVAIVGAPEQAATAWVTIEGLRATHGRDGVQVLDWRPRPASDHVPIGGGMPPPLSGQSSGMP